LKRGFNGRQGFKKRDEGGGLNRKRTFLLRKERCYQ